MTTGIETERKFVLAKGQELPGLDDVAEVGPVEEHGLVAVYYDTPDYRLYHAGRELRRRTGGPDAGWQLKLPTDDPDARIEISAPLVEPRLPFALRRRVNDLVEEQPLFPVAELHTAREARHLQAPDGTVLARVFTDRVRASVSGRLQEWSEVEVELVHGGRRLLDQVEATLRAAGVPRSPVSSKFAQAVAERAARVEQQDEEAPLAGTVLLAYLGRQIGVLQALEADVAADGFDAVHRSRVATRRLRGCLRTYAGVFRGPAVHSLEEELRAYGEQLGAPRDAEVLRERLRSALEESGLAGDPVAALVLDRLEQRHAQAHRALVDALADERFWRLQVALEQLLAEPPLEATAGDPASVALPNLLGHAVQRVRRRSEHAAARGDDLSRWHAVRKAAKAVRYAAEVLVPVLGGRAERRVAEWTQVTTLFGEVQDAAITARLIGELRLEASEAGLPAAPLDELRHAQDKLLVDSLSRARAVLKRCLRSPEAIAG